MKRFLHPLVGLALVLVVAGCAAAEGETPGQRFFGLKADYSSLLAVAVAYRDQCEAKAVELRLGCDDVVEAMQSIDREQIHPAIEQAEAALAAGSSAELAAANVALGAALGGLRVYIVEKQLDGGAP